MVVTRQHGKGNQSLDRINLSLYYHGTPQHLVTQQQIVDLYTGSYTNEFKEYPRATSTIRKGTKAQCALLTSQNDVQTRQLEPSGPQVRTQSYVTRNHCVLAPLLNRKPEDWADNATLGDRIYWRNR